ncbi:putative oxidoreductase protein [Aurantimonas manganoxydans SI85-9A1]|uniref:Putative oxidoreductase protein n=2 Tax=Aurantimonas manganoxydans TaxID=651183 RepID=Q1YLB8_AURMS|nr:putative oxidoreductase protein [Aurantimonas manganoxydans SI85-9A1]
MASEETSMKGALIGCGFFAQNQLHAWRDIDGAEIVALCDRDPERLAATAETFGITRTYTDAAAMFAAEELDFVDIATTVQSHRPLVEMAAGAGCHVICQKPFAETMDDARAMVAAVEAAGRTLMVHENFRWQSAVRKAIETVRSGAIGTPFFGRVAFRSGYDVYSGQPYLAEGERFIIEDLGIHILDISRALFGDVERIAATTKRVNPKIRGEDVATMLLAHEGGVTSVVDCSYATRRTPETFPQSLLEIDGAEGTLRLDAGYSLVVQTGGNETVTDVSPPILPWAERPWHNIQESVRIIQQHFVACIDAGTQPETSGADNLKTLALVQAAYRSAETGETVRLSGI